MDEQERKVDNYVPQEPDEPRGKIRFIKPGEFCLAILNTPGMIVTEEDKQRFIEELREHHANGRYIVGIKDSDQFKISSKNPESLAKQIQNFDELIRMTFERQ